MECSGSDFATSKPVTLQSDATLTFEQQAALEIKATIAWSSSQSKDLSLVTELTNKGPSDAGGIECEISYPSDLLLPKFKSLANCTTAKGQPMVCQLANIAGTYTTNTIFPFQCY